MKENKKLGLSMRQSMEWKKNFSKARLKTLCYNFIFRLFLWDLAISVELKQKWANLANNESTLLHAAPYNNIQNGARKLKL